MFITCACTIESSSQDAVLQLQPGELAGVFCRTALFTPHTNALTGAKWVTLEELQATGAPGSVSAAIAAPAVAWAQARASGDGDRQRAAVMHARQLGKTPGASVFFSSCL